MKDIINVREIKNYDESIVQQMLIQLPTPDEIKTIVTKRNIQRTFEKYDFFESGDQHIGKILPQIKNSLLTKPMLLQEEDEEEFREQIMKELSDEKI